VRSNFAPEAIDTQVMARVTVDYAVHGTQRPVGSAGQGVGAVVTGH